MKYSIALSIAAVLSLAGCQTSFDADLDLSRNAREAARVLELEVSSDGRYLERSNGRPFVWVGDTAWELFHKLDREEATEYLENRAEKGFSIIQAVVLAENDGLRSPNPYGDLPLVDLDPAQPNEAYFEHVDFIVNKAEELGLMVGMLPTWGDKVPSANPGAGPEVFNPQNAEAYGEYLGRRYKDSAVVWILGGDRNMLNDEVLEIWRSLARGLQRGDGGRHLITYHPRGSANSFYWLHNEEWLDFNMYQSGHEARFNAVYRYAAESARLKPVKPFVDGEPAYEDIAIRFWEFLDWSDPQRVPDEVLDADGLIADTAHFEKGFVSDYDVRVHAYWDYLSGACGYTYGNNAIWQMFKKGGPIAIPALTDWREAMDRPGGADMRHVRDLFESRPLDLLQADQSVVFGENRWGEDYVAAAGASDGSYALVYLAKGQPVRIVMDKIRDKLAVAWWFDPRNGEAQRIGEFASQGLRDFRPPSSGEGNDWVLVLDSVEARYDAPGVW